jgi:putative DNA primase/helicase
MTAPLADLGIYLRNAHRPGEHRAVCPECARRKRGLREQDLAVKVEPDGGATWHCWSASCGWKGSLPAPGSPPRREKPRAEGGQPGQPKTRPTLPAGAPEPHPNKEAAQEVWRQTREITDDLPLSYLLDRRGIEVWDDDRLRWHPECPFGETTVPAIVAPVTCHLTGYTVAIWCIRPTLAGKVKRWGFGPVKGNAARLFPAAGPELVIAEGVEDALAAAELHGLPAWAALSAGNMGELVLPERFRRVLVLADRDENEAGLKGAWTLARRLRAEGRSAEVRWAKAGKDPNDVLLSRRVAT